MTEQTKREIETIADRTITLRLSDADCERLVKKAGAVGLTASELLQYFIGDLVDGTCSNGSDERMLAQQWFDRVGFEHQADKTFLRWLLQYGDIKEFLIRHSMIQECQEDLASPEPMDSREDNLWEMHYQQGQLDEAYAEYCADCWNCTPEPYEAAVERILKWEAELKSLRGWAY